MKRIFSGPIDLIKEKKNTFSFILNEKLLEPYFNELKEFVKVNVERKVAFQFNANNVMTLTDLIKQDKELSYFHCESLFLDLFDQIKKLEKLGFGYLSLHPDNIIYIETDDNNISFVFLDLDNRFAVSNNKLEITKPYSKHMFFSPEIKNITEIPTTINYQQNIFYSLSMIVCDSLKKINSDYKFSDYKSHLTSILETKLYWALLRCLKDKPHDRYCLYI